MALRPHLDLRHHHQPRCDWHASLLLSQVPTFELTAARLIPQGLPLAAERQPALDRSCFPPSFGTQDCPDTTVNVATIGLPMGQVRSKASSISPESPIQKFRGMSSVLRCGV